MAQVKHKQQYRSDDESYTPQSASRSKGEINILDIREELPADLELRLQRIGELLINARIRQDKSRNIQSSTHEDEHCLNPKTYLEAQ